MKTHTPGPWTFRHSSETARPLGWIDSRTDNSLVELRGTSAEGRMDFEANARLIASAPELLEALKDATDALETLWKTSVGNRQNDTIDAARAALSKASTQ